MTDTERATMEHDIDEQLSLAGVVPGGVPSDAWLFRSILRAVWLAGGAAAIRGAIDDLHQKSDAPA